MITHSPIPQNPSFLSFTFISSHVWVEVKKSEAKTAEI